MKSQLEICKISFLSAVESERHEGKMPFELWNTWKDSNINCWNAAGNNGKEMVTMLTVEKTIFLQTGNRGPYIEISIKFHFAQIKKETRISRPVPGGKVIPARINRFWRVSKCARDIVHSSKSRARYAIWDSSSPKYGGPLNSWQIIFLARYEYRSNTTDETFNMVEVLRNYHEKSSRRTRSENNAKHDAGIYFAVKKRGS